MIILNLQFTLELKKETKNTRQQILSFVLHFQLPFRI